MATPTADPFNAAKPDIGSPLYSGAFAITPGAALAFTPRGVYVGSSGNIVATGQDGNSVTFNNLPAAYILPFRAATVASSGSGTTATNLLGLY
jgi:hypothetical protein